MASGIKTAELVPNAFGNSYLGFCKEHSLPRLHRGEIGIAGVKSADGGKPLDSGGGLSGSSNEAL